MENLNNFARPEASLAFAYPAGPAIDLECSYPCEECGTLCDERFCCAECERDAHTIWVDEPEDNIDSPLPYETETPKEYREWLDDFEPYDYWE